MNIPQDLLYTSEHEWVRIEGDIAVIGITDFAQSQLGDIVYVDIETVGDEVEANDVFGSVEAVKTVSDLFMPITGTILEVNAALEDDPQFVNEEPYGSGWMIKVQISEGADRSALLSAADYEAQVENA
ncbi:MAG: glycine cleavage system protein GcvH [Bacteroidia bacterium]|nr:glycine cleavage system protein GcvH [Bacteroidia bacterium]